MQTIEIDGLLYGAENPKIKTIHGKTGEVVIGGFQRFMHTATDFDACYNSGVYDGQGCDLCPHGAECSGKEDAE